MIDTLVPAMEGDTISLLGGGDAGKDLKWRYEWGLQSSKLIIDVPEAAVAQVDHAWAFQVAYAMEFEDPDYSQVSN